MKEVLDEAGVEGPRRVPRDYGVQAVLAGVPLNALQRWLGQSALAATALYAEADRPKAEVLMARMWAEGPEA